MPPEPVDEEDPTVLQGKAPDPDTVDLNDPTIRSEILRLPSGFDEVPTPLDPSFLAEPTVKLHSDAEAPTLIQSALKIERRSRRRRAEAHRKALTTLAMKSSLAGLAVGLLILVPLTLAVIWSSLQASM